ncbi:phage protein [Proteus mirabilis]|nr:phage protein [Proteus mirabilis]
MRMEKLTNVTYGTAGLTAFLPVFRYMNGDLLSGWRSAWFSV